MPSTRRWLIVSTPRRSKKPNRPFPSLPPPKRPLGQGEAAVRGVSVANTPCPLTVAAGPYAGPPGGRKAYRSSLCGFAQQGPGR